MLSTVSAYSEVWASLGGQELQMKQCLVEMISNIVRKKRKVFGLNFCRGFDLLLLMIGKCCDSPLEHSVNSHVRAIALLLSSP